MPKQHHILVAQVQDRPGVLNRVASLFRRRMFNIESLTVGHTDQPGVSRMTVVVDGAKTSVEQVMKQLYKLIEVTKVSEVTHEGVVAHELAHSWAGNLVTNATWRDLWLNEGITTYIERRIVEELDGADRAASLGDERQSVHVGVHREADVRPRAQHEPPEVAHVLGDGLGRAGWDHVLAADGEAGRHRDGKGDGQLEKSEPQRRRDAVGAPHGAKRQQHARRWADEQRIDEPARGDFPEQDQGRDHRGSP